MRTAHNQTTTGFQLLGLVLGAQLALAAPAAPAGTTPNTVEKRARNLNCSGYEQQCRDQGTICMNDDYPLSNNQWCASHCRCDYYFECPALGGCKVAQPGAGAGEGEGESGKTETATAE